MAVVCVIFFSCGEDEDKQVHSITAFAGYGGATATADKEIAVAGEAVTVTATPAEGFVFKEWKVRVGNTVIENTEANPSVFTMPVEDVVVVATFMIKNDVLERITDPVLKAYCQSRMDTEQEIDGVTYPKWDTNGNGVLSPEEAAEIRAIDVTGGVNGVKIKSVNGLIEFAGLEILKISGNELTTLNVAWTKLAKLDCSHNELTDLSVGGSENLKELYCNNNHLALLNLRTMIDKEGYMLHCGNQTTIEGDAQSVEIKLSGEQISFWENSLKNLSENTNVEAKVIPDADLYLTMTSGRILLVGDLYLMLSDNNGNSIQLVLNSLNKLLPGEYSKGQLNTGSSMVSPKGRRLDANNPGYLSVKKDETTGVYTIEGVLNLTPNASSPSVNVVAFEYLGKL